MEITLQSHFSTPIFHGVLDHDNYELAKYCKKLSLQEKGIIATNINGWHSAPYFLENCENNLLKSLAEKVLATTQDICNHLNIRPYLKLKMKEFWINVNRKKSRNASHDHPASDFSAVYYVQANPDSGDIGFGNPSQMMEFWWRSRTIQTKNCISSMVTYKPETGKLIVFPSWLVHFVKPNNTEKDRISIAFNMTLYNTNDYV